MGKEFDNIAAQFSEEMLEAPATYRNIVECLKGLSDTSDALVRLNFAIEEQRKFNNIAISAMIDYLGLYIKAIAEKTNYVFDENRYLDDFIKFFEKRLKPYNKMVEEHQDVLKNL